MPDRDIRPPGWHGMLPRPPRQIGRRGAMLLSLGAIWIVLGLGVLDSTSTTVVAPHEALPQTWRGAAWIITGTIAVAYAIRPKGLPDHHGFAALAAMPIVRVVSYTLAWVDHLLPIGGDGYRLGWRFAATYAAMLAAVLVTAGWPDPHPDHRHRGRTRRRGGVDDR